MKSENPPIKIARFVCRDDGKTGVILGKNFGLFKPNKVYEVREVLGEFIIKEVGPSAIGTNKFSDSLSTTNWAHTTNEIVQNGHHLHTKSEYKAICKRDKQ